MTLRDPRSWWILTSAIVVALALACGGRDSPTGPGRQPSPSPTPTQTPTPSATPTPGPSPTPTPAARIRVGLTVNGLRYGSFSCTDGLFFATSVTNEGSHAVDLDGISVSFSPHASGCSAHAAPIGSRLSVHLKAGATAMVSRFDAAGTLCRPPSGDPSCSWTATSEVTAGPTTAQDRIGLATYEPKTIGCRSGSSLITPAEGSAVSGTVDVQATVTEGDGCIMSARAIAEGFSELGVPAFRSYQMDVGDRFHWDTRRNPNGRYWITAYQNCCGKRSPPTPVAVRN